MKNIVLAATALFLSTAIAHADPYCAPCPNNCDELGFDDEDDCRDIQGRSGVCCVDLSDEAREIVDAQEEVLEDDRPNPSQERCPAGFTPSEQKCSPSERRDGCKDIRIPSGLGCVSSDFR